MNTTNNNREPLMHPQLRELIKTLETALDQPRRRRAAIEAALTYLLGFCDCDAKHVADEHNPDAGFDHWLRTGFTQELAARGVDVTVNGNTITMRDRPSKRR